MFGNLVVGRERAASEQSADEGGNEDREEHGGQYVALDGDQLLAVGPNYRIAREKALAAGKPNAFVTYLSKPDEVAEMGGWA